MTSPLVAGPVPASIAQTADYQGIVGARARHRVLMIVG